MSWDILIQDFPQGASDIDDIPDDYKPASLGARSEVIASIQQLLPEADFSDPSWGVLDREEFSIEFNIGNSDICHSIMLHVRGGGGAVATIERLLEHLHRRAWDCQAGDFFSSQAAMASFGEWQQYRDR